jgi:hypothetical protein
MMRSMLFVACCLTTCANTAHATEYHVGPGRPYATIGEAPWANLQPGDSIQIHWKSSPYKEKILVTRSGFSWAPIRIMGVPGPNGELPRIEGKNAVTNPQFRLRYRPIEDAGLLTVWDTGHFPGIVSNVEISGLDFSGAFRESDENPATYSAFDGTTRQWAWTGAAIYVIAGSHITIRNCWVHDSSNGIFVSGGRDNEDIKVDGCRIWGNSNPNIPRVHYTHNVYVECRGFTFTNNWCGPTRPGSPGCNIKCRNAGDVIRNNYIEGGMRLLDLIEFQENKSIGADPRYGQDIVDHNTLVTGNGQAHKFIHYGYEWLRDPANGAQRKRLTFTNNVLICKTDSSDSNTISCFDITSPKQTVDAVGNVFVAQPNGRTQPAALTWVNNSGVLNLGKNIMWPRPLNDSWPSRLSDAAISGKSNVVVANPILNAGYKPATKGPAAGAGWSGSLAPPSAAATGRH